METNIISELQPLFCSRAALLKAQDKMDSNPDMDCQLLIRFADGSQAPLPIKRAGIASIIALEKYTVEGDIDKTINPTAEGETETTDQTNE